MLAKAKSKYIKVSPYKLRPLVDVIRGSRLDKALAWLKTCHMRRAEPLLKVVNSAFANANNKHNSTLATNEVMIQDIRVDQGPIITYFKPGAMGRTSLQRKRMSHIEVVLGKKTA